MTRASTVADLDEAESFLAGALGNVDSLEANLTFAARCIDNAVWRGDVLKGALAKLAEIEADILKLQQWCASGAPDA